MKHTFIIFLILISYSLKAQQNKDTIRINYPSWSMSANGGLIIPFGKFGNLFNNSFSGGLEISYHASHRLAFFFNSQYDFLSAVSQNYTGTAGYIELTSGVRTYLGKSPEVFFIEAGLGDYTYYFTTNIVNMNSSYFYNYLGVKAGIGGNFILTKGLLFFIKTDFHVVFSANYLTYFPGIYGGFRLVL